MHESLYRQIRALLGYQHLRPTVSLYALPNGDTTTDRQYAREQWELYNLTKPTKCNVAGKNKYCAGRL